MDFYVCLERAGYRVARRRRCKARVGVQHRVTKEDAIKWWVYAWSGDIYLPILLSRTNTCHILVVLCTMHVHLIVACCSNMSPCFHNMQCVTHMVVGYPFELYVCVALIHRFQTKFEGVVLNKAYNS